MTCVILPPSRSLYVNGGTKVRRLAGRRESAAPLERSSENVGLASATVAAGIDMRQEAQECTATWTSGLRYTAGFWWKE